MRTRSKRYVSPSRSNHAKARFLRNERTTATIEPSDSSGDIISCREIGSTVTSQPVTPAAAGSSEAYAAASPAVKCGICLDDVPADSLLKSVMNALGSGASSSAAAGRRGCRHSFCIDCMRQFVTTQVKVRVLIHLLDLVGRNSLRPVGQLMQRQSRHGCATSASGAW